MKAPYAGITFLTYEDVAVGDRFYREVLGLPLIEDQGWAKVYRIHGSSHVGIVSARRGPIDKPVGSGTLLSIVVEDVDAWYETLRNESSIEILGPPAMVGELPVYSFFLKDPAGYHVEIQAFTDDETQQRFGHISGQLRASTKDCRCSDSGCGCQKDA
ncbi:VOC family protein [Candidatus Bipolaricaulota bacterium]|jgi:predicted enzyme related to lactoylglutathione lyase|nr:VOC family protein [Candidatus Bipolaricaulota bacterium]TFH08311.1 MAG: VOC family protein [Candidatus Atribacteria bacterium]